MFRVAFQRKVGKGSLVALVFLVAVGVASASSLAPRGDAPAARKAMSSTHLLSRAHGHASRVARHSPSGSLLGSPWLFHRSRFAAAPFASTGCGASGTIADKSGFEDTDANLVVNKAGCMDWNGFAPVTWTGSVPYQSAAKTVGAFTFFGSSDAVSATDSMYGGGVKQVDKCPATGPGNVNVKSDLARIYGAVSTDPVTKHVFLDLALVRGPLNTTSSDVHVAFEFNQSKTPCGGSSGVVKRTPGDILLGYDLNSGTATILYSQWTGSTWTTAVTLPASIAEASFFTGASTTDGIKPSNGLNPNTDEFGEAGID